LKGSTEDQLSEVLSECLSEEGTDASLMTDLDLQCFQLYGELRLKLSKKYPNPIPIAEREDPDDSIDISLARHDVDGRTFMRRVMKAHSMFERIRTLQDCCSEYEKKVVRVYVRTARNWNIATGKMHKAFLDSDLYEIVESYFNILRKHGVSTPEEPYYFLSPERKRRVEHEGRMLKRTTEMGENEIKVSILEALT